MRVIYIIDLTEYRLENKEDLGVHVESYLCYESKKTPPVVIPGMAMYLPGFQGAYVQVLDDVGISWFEEQEKFVIELDPDAFSGLDNVIGEETWRSLLQNGWIIKNLSIGDL